MLRSFSIIAVWMFHYHLPHLYASSESSWVLSVWRRFSINGAYGVQIFFVVSGFLITRLIAGQRGGLFQADPKEFYFRRASRILPLLFLSLVLGGAFLLLGRSDAAGFGFCLRNPQAGFNGFFWASIAAFYFNWFRGFWAPAADFGLQWDILWSLSIEEQFYFFYPLALKRLASEKNLYRFLGCFLLAGPLVRGAGLFWFPDQPYWFLNSFCEFDLIAIGCLLYLVCANHSRFLAAKQGACWFFCLTGIFLVVKTFLELPSDLDYFRRMFGASFIGWGTFLFLLGALHLKIFEHKFLKPLAWPGKLSYGGYLLHPIVLYLAWPWLLGRGEGLGFFGFALAALLAAGVSYQFYEAPANRWLRRRWSRF